MIDLINKNLHIHQLLKDNITIFKNIFIEYYGEENREFIENKFSHLKTIGFTSTDNICTLLGDFEKETSKNILNKQDFSGLPLTEEELFGKYHLEYYDSLMPIGSAEKFIDYIQVDKNKRFEDYKNKCFIDLKDSIDGFSTEGFTKEEYEEIWNNQELPEKLLQKPLWIQDRVRFFCSEEGYKNEVSIIYKTAAKFLEKLYPGITIDNFDQVVSENKELTDKLIEISNKARICKEEYDKEKEKYKEFYSQIKELSDLSHKLSNEYYRMFVTENFDLVPEDEKEKTLDALKRNNFYKMSETTKSYFGTTIISNCSVPAYSFSSEAEEKLNSDTTTPYTKEKILRTRVKFFKQNGIDLGDDYNAYIENEEVRKIIPSKERVDKLEKSFFDIKNKYNNHLYTSLSVHKKLREEVDELGLLEKDDGLDATIHTRPTTCVVPNFIDGPNGVELFPLVIVSPDNDGRYTDHKIIHELNHIVELYVTDVNEKTFDAICGWDVLGGTFSNTRDDVNTITKRDLRPYELINEVVNEVIAQEISELMQSKGIVVADDKEKSKYIGCTSYEATSFIIRDFYKEFKDVILKSRRNGKIQLLFDEVGKENFDELSNLFKVYNDNFNAFSFGSTLMDRKEGRETKQTKKLQEIIDSRDKIMDKMRMYSANRHQEIKNNMIQEQQNTSVY